MHEVNLWFCLQEAGDDWEFAEVREKALRIEQLITGFDAHTIKADFRILNGKYYVTLTCFANRPRAHELGIIDSLVSEVVHLLPGSYGLIYERDDERTDFPGHDAFKVTVLARGKLSVRVDPFLSPVSLVVDDEEGMSDGG
ncbi:Imm7 family immunity protein [Kribbella lupini]|uniref:Imm7 family immunity protein n=1 Tax=Kribbella lupini TaxID=291602 RepID=A0ABP4MGA0_9ACTN